MDLLFQNFDFKKSLREPPGGTSARNEKQNDKEAKTKGKQSKSVSKLDKVEEESEKNKQIKQPKKAVPRKPDIPNSKKHNFYEIYKNYVKPPSEKQNLSGLINPKIILIANAQSYNKKESKTSQQSEESKPEIESNTRNTGIQTEYSFQNFVKVYPKFVSILNNDEIEYEYDANDFFEFLISLKENGAS